METLLIAMIWMLNLGISFWNAYAVGKSWTEAKSAGGWPRFMTWMGAIMSASGFTWCYLTLLALTGYYFQFLTLADVGLALQLGYVIIIPGIIFSGLMITVNSWAVAYRRGGILNYGVAAYNTYAHYHNTASAIRGFGPALGNVIDGFKGKSRSRSSSDSKGAGALVLIALVVLAVVAGTLTTVMLIKHFASSEPLLSPEEMKRRQAAQ
jgi:hypothetical protein